MPKKALLTLAMLLVVTASALAQDQPADTPLPLKAGLAYPNLRIRRPVVVTHAGDGSQRTFVVTQQGVIQILPEDRQAEEAAVFLDIESRVMYKDRENEEGLLGLAFHPRYRENGQFFVYYTTKDAPHTSVISRFRVSADPQKGDPASEEELLRIPSRSGIITVATWSSVPMVTSTSDWAMVVMPMTRSDMVRTWVPSSVRFCELMWIIGIPG